LLDNLNMSQTINVSEVQDALSLQNRITELESVLRTVLEQINSHQIYDKDARVLIHRTLVAGHASASEPGLSEPPHPNRAREFPSFFPSAVRSSNYA
jgi:hypothetical protein